MDRVFSFKKTAAFVLSLALVGMTTGCGGNSSSGGDASQSSAVFDWTAVPFTNTDLNTEQFKATLTAQGNLARLKRVLNKAENGEKIVVGAFGGSITEGMSASSPSRSYSSLVTAWFNETFPDAGAELVNGGIGATGSIIGASRIDADLLAKKPDLVIVEFACNDGISELEREAYEGIVRRILSQDNQPAVILLFMSTRTATNSQRSQIIIGKKYDLPMISYHDGVQAAIKAGDIKWTDLSPDDVHPNDRGHRLAADLIIHRLMAVRQYADQISEDIPPLPESSTRFANATILDNQSLNAISLGAFTAQNGLYYDKPSLSRGWVATEYDNPLVFETEAKVVTLIFKRMVMSRGATAQVLVDGVEVARLKSDFQGGFGEYADLKTIINREETTKLQVEIKLVEESGIPANSRFLLLAVCTSQ